MKVIRPSAITLLSSSVPELDHAAWSAGTGYAAGDRVTVAAVGRNYESVGGDNIGHDPVASVGYWIDIGPTNRWAMFDQAVGSMTSAADSIVVTLSTGGAIDAVGLLEVAADSVRVRVLVGGTPIHDETQSVDGRSAVLFLDLPGDPAMEVEVTVSGTGTVSVGTLTTGTTIDLGLTEASPTIGINDFSRRETDDFGVTTVVERGWARVMALRTKLATGDVDTVQRSVAALRARPCLWIGEEGYDCLAVYGFFKDFSIDLALPEVSYCTLRVEGLV